MAAPKSTKPKTSTRSKSQASKEARPTPHNGSGNGKAPHAADDGLKLWRAKNAALKALSAQVSKAAGEERVDKLRELTRTWLNHCALEEHVVFPAIAQAGVERQLIEEIELEQDLAFLLLSDLLSRSAEDELFESEAMVFCRLVPRLVALEDKAGTGLIAKAKKAGIDPMSLGTALQEAEAQVHQIAEDRLRSPLPRHLRGAGNRKQAKEYDNMRNNERERDDNGRFMRDDDRRGGGGGQHSRRSMSHSGGSGSRYDDNDDGRGWHGDPRGHSEASRHGWDERRSQGGGSRSSGRYADDEDDRGQRSRGRSQGGDRGEHRSGGWFGDSEGHSEASRRGWQNSDHGDSGWYGDREGHSQASRRGWQNPDHGDSGWFGDREGHSEASRRGWQNRDHGDSGWFGDPEGHSEASRRGWESRSGSRRSRDDDDDDDRRSSRRSRSRD